MSRALVISRVFPPQVGGNGHWMRQLYGRMATHEYLVVADRYPGSDAYDAEHRLPIIREPLQFESWGAFGVRRGAAYCRVFRRLCDVVKQYRIAAVHASNCLPEGFLAWMLHRRFGLPYLVFVHGEELNVAQSSLELRWMTRRVYRDAALVIANSGNTAQLLRNDWPVTDGRLRIMHPGVDTSVFRPARRDVALRQRLGWHDRPVIVTVGRLMKRKGHDLIIRALPTIRRAVPDVLYAIVGDGEEQPNLRRQIAELDLSGHVIMHGELQCEELVGAFQQADLFAMPNREVAGDFEGFGIVLLEAQACGLPVVAGRSGGAPETMNERATGRLVNPECQQELAATLVELLLDGDLRQTMGAAGREWIVGRFDWDVLLRRARDLFASVRPGESVERHAQLAAAAG